MTHPYKQFENTALWEVLNNAIADLVENHDIDETTQREYIVVYLCKVLAESEAGKILEVIEVSHRE